MSDYKIFELGNFTTQNGITIPDAKLAYKVFGELNEKKDNLIVYPTWYSGQHYDNEWLIGEGMALDPAKYCIVIPNMFGNGLSSSPSNTPAPYNGPRFPLTTLWDNVAAQHRLVTELFGVEKIALVTGWSMGAQQTFQWGAQYPEMVERIAPFCGSAKTSVHNYVFLESVKAALTADAAWNNGWYTTPPNIGLRAVGRVYAGWGFSQAFYREKLYEQLGYASLEDFLVGFWEGFFVPRDANNLLAMLRTWQTGDISANAIYGGDFDKALGAITAKAIVLPGSTDLYFRAKDSAYEVSKMPNAVFRPIESIWGHFAGGPGLNPVDVKALDASLKELLAS